MSGGFLRSGYLDFRRKKLSSCKILQLLAEMLWKVHRQDIYIYNKNKWIKSRD